MVVACNVAPKTGMMMDPSLHKKGKQTGVAGNMALRTATMCMPREPEHGILHEDELVSRICAPDGFEGSTLVQNLRPPDNAMRLWKTCPSEASESEWGKQHHVEDTFSVTTPRKVQATSA